MSRRLLLLALLVPMSLGIAAARAAPAKDVSIPPSSSTKTKKYIRKITIKIGDIFEDDSGTLYNIANATKVSTRESVIRTEMLFKEGDAFDPYLLRQTARNLRLQRYLRDIKVVPTFDGDAVDIVVSARDSWTLIPFLSYSSGTGQRNRGIGISEGNFLGGATRVDTRYQEQDSRQTYAISVTDPQFLGTQHNFGVGLAERSDGEVYHASVGLPFRHLLQRDSWTIETQRQNTIGRLYEGGDENYIFRQHLDTFQALYTFAGPGAKAAEVDDPYTGIYKGQKVLSQHYSVGWAYQAASFFQADASDFADLNLDPNIVSNDPARLAANRRFNGPMVQYSNIQPEFISMNYIDRFDRVEDYNLGDESLFNVQFSPRQLGSRENSFLFNANRSKGWRFDERTFLRGEIGGASRFDTDQFDNTLVRAETKYYSVLGDYFVGDRFLGRHTIAAQFFADFGDDLDNDRQLLLGADNSLRGYEMNTFEGDKRMALNLEERAHIADDVFQVVSVGTALFLDVGGATREDLSAIVTDDLYGDVGFGLRFCFPRSSGGGVVRMDIAFPMRDGPDGSKAWEPRIVFAAGQLFGVRLRSESVGAENASSGIGFDR